MKSELFATGGSDQSHQDDDGDTGNGDPPPKG